MYWCDVLPSNWAVLFHSGTSRPGSGRLGQDENAVVMVFLDASGMITYLRVKETKTGELKKVFPNRNRGMITYLRVKETKTWIRRVPNLMMATDNKGYLRVKETKTTVIQ